MKGRAEERETREQSVCRARMSRGRNKIGKKLVPLLHFLTLFLVSVVDLIKSEIFWYLKVWPGTVSCGRKRATFDSLLAKARVEGGKRFYGTDYRETENYGAADKVMLSRETVMLLESLCCYAAVMEENGETKGCECDMNAKFSEVLVLEKDGRLRSLLLLMRFVIWFELQACPVLDLKCWEPSRVSRVPELSSDVIYITYFNS